MTIEQLQPSINLLAGEFYGTGARDAYDWMRRNAPLYFDANTGLWAISTYDGVLAAERDSALFSNEGGSRPDTGPLPWMIDMDGTAHAKRRKLVNRGFTPARVREGEARVRALCDELIDQVCERGTCDFVHDLAARLPLIIIADMLGIPPEDRDQLLSWSDAMLGSLTGSQESLESAAVAFGEYDAYARRMMADRRDNPSDDLVSVLVHAEVDGDRLADDEVLMETLLLLVGGDETTRHVTSGGMEQLQRNPAARQRVEENPDLLPNAVEEMLRWVSPIKNMNRTVTRDAEVLGQKLEQGDKVLLLYEAANFDDEHFDRPEQFDIARTPNDHLAFGFGPHFCLGASLARVEIRVMFERLLHRLPDLEPAAEPTRSVLGTIESMPVRFTPSTAP